MTSSTEQKLPTTEYLFDYVYIDHQRLSQYYAQLSKHGVVTNSKRTSKLLNKDAYQATASAIVVGGKYDAESTSEEGVEHNIDSAYSRPHETINALDEAGFIVRGFMKARLGSMVLIPGELSLFDIRMLKEMWKPIMSMTVHNDAESLPPKDKQRYITEQTKFFDRMIGILEKMPHALQATLTSGLESVWFTLNPAFMLINPEDFTLKHGSFIAGEWQVLGIIDALPDDKAGFVPTVDHLNTLETAMTTVLQSFKNFYGRPAERYGITPIMIFRIVRPE